MEHLVDDECDEFDDGDVLECCKKILVQLFPDNDGNIDVDGVMTAVSDDDSWFGGECVINEVSCQLRRLNPRPAPRRSVEPATSAGMVAVPAAVRQQLVILFL